MRPFGDQRSLEQRRLKAVELLSKGLGPAEISRQVHVDRRSVHRWLAAYRDRGVDGLAPRPIPGRPSKLSSYDRKRLTDMILEGARSFGYASDRWTCPRVADLICRHFNVTYHANHISRILHSLGFQPQKLKRRGQELNRFEIRGWTRDD